MLPQIYYFSGIGKSLHIARELQNRIPGTGLIPIVSLLDKKESILTAESVKCQTPEIIYLKRW